MQILQVQPSFCSTTGDVFFYSIECSTTVYLDNANCNGRTVSIIKKPYFIQQYTVNIKQESISRLVPLVKVEAISRNSNNSINMIYMILDDMEGLFYIDVIDGFIYTHRDYGLEPRTYTITVS